MIILTDCLSQKVDEGCIKVATTLANRIKELYSDTVLVAYKNHSDKADENLDLNPLFLNSSIRKVLKKADSAVLYIPFASNTLASTLRTFMLSLINKKKVYVLFALRHQMNTLSRLLLKLSKATVIALSEQSYTFYKQVAADKVVYLKTGVDTKKFLPVDADTKMKLRKKYSLPADKNIVLHVGHLNSGRNVQKLLNLDDNSHGVLVLSSVTKDERDLQLKEKLESSGKVTLIYDYIENIEEVYQFSDVYLFPVFEQGKCIDVPLSVLEAASCNIPVICTEYGELKSFKNEKGFYFTDDFEYKNLNDMIGKACFDSHSTRDAVADYDWEKSINRLMQLKD